jgi:DNA polymerase-3 subunit epsilon
VPPSDIATIDFETATARRSSACAVGVAIPRADGQIDTRSWFIRPPDNEYDSFNTRIHGITPVDTENAATLPDIWPEIDALIGGRALAAHNASFDLSVLRQSLGVHDAVIPRDYRYLCTYRLARLVWPDRWTYRLSDIARDLGFETDNHHDPRWDAWAAAQVADALTIASECTTLTEVAETLGFRIGTMYTDLSEWDPFSDAVTSGGRAWKAKDVLTVREADEDHPLFDHCVVITGTLPNGMVRREAYQRIVDLGGRVADNVSKKVNILVVADLDPVVVGEDGRSGKLRKAITLAEKGEPIELMDARDFIRILG